MCIGVYFSSAAMLLNPSLVNTWFERISIMVILLNCVTLGMYQPCENIDCTSDRCQILQVSWPAVFMCAHVCALRMRWNKIFNYLPQIQSSSCIASYCYSSSCDSCTLQFFFCWFFFPSVMFIFSPTL